MKRRAPNLTDEAVNGIVRILDGWTGALSWETLVDTIFARTKHKYTRQALSNRTRIQNAFSDAKLRLRDGDFDIEKPSKPKLPEVQMLEDRVARLENEKSRLSKENEALLIQFSVWAQNAYELGISEAQLNKPRAAPDRGSSVAVEMENKGIGPFRPKGPRVSKASEQASH